MDSKNTYAPLTTNRTPNKNRISQSQQNDIHRCSAIATTIETGIATGTGALGAIAAQKLFEPLALSINLDGTVAVEAAASSGVSIWQAIAASIAPAIQAFTGVVEQAGHLFCAMDPTPQKTTSGRLGVTGEMFSDNFEEFDSEGWLSNHEELGGHTVSRHVGKSDQELLDRLKHSDRIGGASTFKSLEAAESIISKVVKLESSKVSAWLKNANKGSTLRLNFYDSEFFGRGVLKGATEAKNLFGVRIILRSVGDGQCFIFTAFPQ